MSTMRSIYIILCTITCIESANILYIIPFTSTSHYIMLRPIGIELARRGHNVTVITAHKEPDPPTNYREVMVDHKKIWDVLQIERPNIFTMVDLSAEDFHHQILWGGGIGFTEVILNSTTVREFLNETQSFDLVIAEQFFQEAMYILSQKYNAPLALVTTFGNCMRHNILTGNPLQLGTITQDFLDVKAPSTFWGRLRNAYFVVYEYLWWRFNHLEKQSELVNKYLPEFEITASTLYEIQMNASLMLINSHFSYDMPMALLPNIVEIGGIHLSKSNASLPQDLQTLLDKAKHGVVYVSFGSNVRSAELPIEKKNAFLNIFRKLKQVVLWKWEDEQMAGKPSNVVIRKWLPQKDVLAHPNIRAFISHGGLLGTQEATFNGVPIIGIPIYADQYNNLLNAELAGYGKILQYHDINEETLEAALSDVLSNDVMLNKAKKVSLQFQDRPMSPLDTAIFWLEYVIRHKGADLMKNPARHMSWFSYYMLDIYIFVLLLSTAFVVLVAKAGVFVMNLSFESLRVKPKLKKM